MKYFKYEEFKCKCGLCESTGEEMDKAFLERLDNLRGICGFPFIISSGYRCPAHNVLVSKTGINGPHTTGKAVDIKIYGHYAFSLVKNALNQAFTGIGISQKGALESRFIHVDALSPDNAPRPRVWSY